MTLTPLIFNPVTVWWLIRPADRQQCCVPAQTDWHEKVWSSDMQKGIKRASGAQIQNPGSWETGLEERLSRHWINWVLLDRSGECCWSVSGSTKGNWLRQDMFFLKARRDFLSNSETVTTAAEFSANRQTKERKRTAGHFNRWLPSVKVASRCVELPGKWVKEEPRSGTGKTRPS